jgi:hypothetical protein
MGIKNLNGYKMKKACGDAGLGEIYIPRIGSIGTIQAC